MKRKHVIEFEDFPWFPNWIRDAITRLIVVFSRVVGATDALTKVLIRVCREQRVKQIVDLGSGGGGVMPEVVGRMRAQEGTADIELTMCDLYPNAAALETFGNDPSSPIRYLPDAIDARSLTSAPPGLKTMINSFHHLRPEDARRILQSAQEANETIFIYELTDNKMPFWGWCLGLVVGLPLVFLFALVLTPWVRPLKWRQLVFTFLVPIVPMFYAWDGQASLPRIYGLDDLDELLKGLTTESYRWEKGMAKTSKGRSAGIYLLGRSVRDSSVQSTISGV